MSISKEQIRAAALRLNPADREALAEELLLSLSDSESAMIDEAWLEEARRRDAALLAGARRTKPVSEVLDRLVGGTSHEGRDPRLG